MIYESAGWIGNGARGSLSGRIERRVPDNIEKTGYEWLENGDSNHLKPRTPVYAAKGYDPWFRVVARSDEGWTLYEVAANRSAKKVADLLDIRGKTDSVSVDNYASSGVVRTDVLQKPGEVTAFVDTVLGTPLVRVSADYTSGYRLVFELEDGTESDHWYEPDSGELYLSDEAPASGVVLPGKLRAALNGL